MDRLRSIFSDLNRKHLTPLALALVIAVIGLPVVMKHKDSSDQQKTTTTSTGFVPGAHIAKVSEATSEEIEIEGVNGVSKSLGKHDPFVQQAKAGAATSDSGGGSAQASGASAVGSSGGGTAESSGSGGSQTPPSDSSGTTTPSSTSETDTANIQSSEDTAHLERVVTIRFGLQDSEKLYKNLKAIELLPKPESPVITYIGISPHSNSAVFMVQPGVTQKGEGTCMPSSTNCEMVYLRDSSKRNQHSFIVNVAGINQVYKLKLESIKSISSDGRLTANGAMKEQKKSSTK